MAASMSVYCDIVSKGLANERRKTEAHLKQLLNEGVSLDEAIRRVYVPWKTPEQYRALRDEYERIFPRK